MTATVTINGVSYSGTNIAMANGKVMVDGKIIDDDEKQVYITVQGNIESLNVSSCKKIDITGDVSSVATVSGDVNCRNVGGSIKTTSGDVNCTTVAGDVNTTSGDVTGTVFAGDVKTVTGDICT